VNSASPQNTALPICALLLSRKWLAALAVLAIVCCSGCQWLKQNFPRPAQTMPVVFQEPPTLEQLISNVNQNSQKVRELNSGVELTVSGMPKLTGDLSLQRPDNLRLQAGVLGMSNWGIDLGTNRDVFWFWNKASVGALQPVLLYSRHDDFENSGAAQSLPIDPRWVVESLGLFEFGSNEKHEGPYQAKDGHLEIRSVSTNGRRTRTRVTTIDSKYGVVSKQAIYMDDQLIAWFKAFKHEYISEHDVMLPRQIHINFYDETKNVVKLVISLNSIRVNEFYGDGQTLWAMPQPEDVRAINISKQDAFGGNAQRQNPYGGPVGSERPYSPATVSPSEISPSRNSPPANYQSGNRQPDWQPSELGR